MNEKRECKIIQDLLPNYIEKLTNEETNKYIEKHLNECEECKNIFKNMEKKLEANTTKRDEREVKYIKKYNNKLKKLRNILFIIVLLFVVIVGRKTIILSNLSNKANKIKNESNYYIKTETYSKGTISILEAYYKDEKYFGTLTLYSKQKNTIKNTFYKSNLETIMLVDNEETKTLVSNGDIIINPISFTSNNFFENLFLAITTNIDRIKLDGQECYIIKDGNTEKFIDENTGLAIKMIDNQNNRTTDYEYIYGEVKDTDIVKPDITGYTINE